MDTAGLAAASDRDLNVRFRRSWTGPPPENRSARRHHNSGHPSNTLTHNDNTDTDTTARRAAQKAVAVAAVRLGRLERQARLLHAIGKHDAARAAAPIAPEDDLHAAVTQALDVLPMPPAQWTTFAAGHVELTGQAAAKLAQLGLKRSWPDILLLHGVLHGIELKRAGGTLSRTRTVRTRRGRLRIVEGQRDVFPRLDAAGMRLATCDSVDAVLARLTVWGVPLRGPVQ